MINKEEQFKQIVDQNKERILRICRFYAPSEEDCKDMYQEVLINVWKSLEKFRGDSEIGTWIYRIAVNTSLTFAGKLYKRMKLNIDVETSGLKYLLDEDKDEVLVKESRLQELQVQLNQLTVIDKALMGLVLEGLSTKEIADVIGITEPNVRVKIHRIKEDLRVSMKGGGYE
ncbi:RNA polymerase ECF-type sigma factor [Tenuifilaceae bacterium CYCD]|nr:RNA polymerase ECF-type sigma factor [Tenuifilaceae bacterium CYCD]